MSDEDEPWTDTDVLHLIHSVAVFWRVWRKSSAVISYKKIDWRIVLAIGDLSLAAFLISQAKATVVLTTTN